MARLIALATLGLGLAACTAGTPMVAENDPRGAARLAQALAGRVAGPPVACLPAYRTTNMEVIDRDTIIYRDGATTYVQNTNGHCYPGGPGGGYYLVTKKFGTSQSCRGDISTVVHSSSGSFAGSCSFNDFIPYRRPR